MLEAFSRAKRVLIGRPMRSDAMGHQLLPKRIALPIFASDALSSVAYAPDEVLLTLAIAGGVAVTQSVWVGLAVAVVLLVVVLSYRQTVHAYPSGGGDYEVVTKNLGPSWGLVVASALLVDYVLTVAVSISSGARYVTAAIPQLAGQEVPIAVAVVIVLCLLNLRGMREAGSAFAIPTYIYMASIGILIAVGMVKLVTGHLGQAPSAMYDLVPQASHVSGLVGLGGALLVMRAFSSGCAALTGVEAISNGVPSFQRPKSRNAATTLAMLGGIAATMLISILVLARATGVRIVEDPATQLSLNGAPAGDVRLDPVIGQLSSAVFGHGSILFYLITIVTGLILVLAANTAFNGFPTLASVLSRDSFLPRQLYRRGDRLTFSNGIVALSAAAIVLIIAFDAQVTHLIQLYIVGVFISFTLSQVGMIRHWNAKLRNPQRADSRASLLRSRLVNMIGFVLTGPVLIVVLVTKFTRGAWITLLLMGLVFLTQRAIRHHYDTVATQLRVEDYSTRRALPSRVHALVLVSSMSRVTMRAIATARATAPSSLQLVSVVADQAEEERIIRQWRASGLPIPLTILSAPYRDITQVIVQHVRSQRRRSPREMVVVYVPQFLVSHWWENVLHNQTALRLRQALLRIPGVVLTLVPWKLGEDSQVEGEQPIKRQLINDPFRSRQKGPHDSAS